MGRINAFVENFSSCFQLINSVHLGKLLRDVSRNTFKKKWSGKIIIRLLGALRNRIYSLQIDDAAISIKIAEPKIGKRLTGRRTIKCFGQMHTTTTALP